MTMQILLVENNNLNKADSLVSDLESYQVLVAHTAKTAAKQAESTWPNLVVFNAANSDIELSGLQDAISATKLNVPYVVVEKEDNEKVSSPNIFVVSQNDSDDLGKTIKKATHKQKDRFIRLPNLIIDRHQRQILRNDESDHLTPKAFKLLTLLVEHKDHDLSRRTIMKDVWETDYMGDTRTLDVHIRWLREKIEDTPNRPRRIITIRGVGYHFLTNPEE